jgi:hypothetical protein
LNVPLCRNKIPQIAFHHLHRGARVTKSVNARIRVRCGAHQRTQHPPEHKNNSGGNACRDQKLGQRKSAGALTLLRERKSGASPCSRLVMAGQ